MSDRNEQTIFRNASPDKPFTILPNALIQGGELTPEEGWMLVYMLSQPKNWTLNVKNVAAACKMGRDRVYKAIEGLREKLLCKRTEGRNSAGRVSGYAYLFTDTPGQFGGPLPENQEPEPQPLPENPDTDSPLPEIQGAYKETTLQSKKSTKKKKSARGAPAAAVFPLLEDWGTPPEWGEWALKESPEHADMLEAEARKFKRYWREQAAAKTASEWFVSWQRWWDRTISRPPEEPRAVAHSGRKGVKDWSSGATVHDNQEPFKVYAARMKAEGKWRVSA